MGITKKDLFTLKQNQIADWARVLGHPARIAIIEYLIKSNTCINSDLVQELGLAQATISQHLKELKNLGVIKGNIEGASMSYCIDTDVWRSIHKRFDEFFNHSVDPKSCC